jgi:hypothetical protein
MSTKIYQRCKPIAVGVNASVEFDGYGIDGFLPITSGTITLASSFGQALLTAFPVTAGVPVPLPIGWTDSAEGCIFTTAGGASGVILI